MEIFSWNPNGPETVEAFNARLQAYCDANPIIDVQVSAAHQTVLLSLTEATDAGEEPDGVPLILPVVEHLSPERLASAETSLGPVLQALRDRDTDDNPSIPFRTTLHALSDGGAVAVTLVGGAVLEASQPDHGGAVPPHIRDGR